MNQSDEMHDLLIEIINEVEKDMEIYEIREKPLKKRNIGLRPTKAYRTADLLSYMYEKCNKESKKLQAMHILEECFQQCTLTALYYINLEDLRCLIKYHKEENLWRIQIIKNGGNKVIQDIESLKHYYDYLNEKNFIDEGEEQHELEKNKENLINQITNCNLGFLLKLYEKAKSYDKTGWKTYKACREILNVNLSELYYVSEPDFFIDKSGYELTEMCEKIFFNDGGLEKNLSEYKKGLYRLSIKNIIYSMDTITYKYFLEDVFDIIKDLVASKITEDNRALFEIYHLLLNNL